MSGPTEPIAPSRVFRLPNTQQDRDALRRGFNDALEARKTLHVDWVYLETFIAALARSDRDFAKALHARLGEILAEAPR